MELIIEETGMLNRKELSKKIGVSEKVITRWHKNGLLKGYKINARNECLYEVPEDDFTSTITLKT